MPSHNKLRTANHLSAVRRSKYCIPVRFIVDYRNPFMSPNPFLKKLGFSDNDRLVILHTDDIGMCHASVQAFQDLWQLGTITSGATMVPCPWFPAVAKMCRENPDIDMGVHATLNA